MKRSEFKKSSARSIFLSAAVLLAVSLVLAGCGGKKDSLVEGKVNVVTTFYPLYFLAKEIGGDNANVVNLVPAGVEPHDWTPKSKDLQTASDAQIFLYHGAGMEGWSEDFLHGLDSDSKLLTVEASKGIDLISAEEAEEHAAEDEHAAEEERAGKEEHAAGEDHAAEEEHGHDHSGVDPHTWVSPKSALQLAENVKNAYVQADAANKADYESRFNALQDKLTAIDSEYTTGLSSYKGKDFVVSHQAFGYLARDYGLHQTAVMGLSPDVEPTAQDMVKIIQFIKENNIKVILFEELVSNGLAETIAEETGVETLVLNPLEGLTPGQEEAGDDYLTLMQRNLQNLQKSLQ